MKMRLKFTSGDVRLTYSGGDKFVEWEDKPENRPERLFFKINTRTSILLEEPRAIENNLYVSNVIFDNKVLNLVLGGLRCILDEYVKKSAIYAVDVNGDRYHVENVIVGPLNHIRGYWGDFLQGCVVLIYNYKGKQAVNAINVQTNIIASELQNFS